MRRFLLILLGIIVVGAGITIAISFYQPPMRLMPAPAVLLDGRANIFSDDPARAPEPEIDLFYATNREALGTPDDRDYARVAGEDLHAGVVTIRIGEDGTTWDRIYEWSTRAGDEQRPFLHLERVDEQATIVPGQPLSGAPLPGTWRIRPRADAAPAVPAGAGELTPASAGGSVSRPSAGDCASLRARRQVPRCRDRRRWTTGWRPA